MKIIRYSSEHKDRWNQFLERCKNTHFIFNRNFMDYHSDRFEDNSLIFENDKNNIIALFPANKSENIIYSHQGLTFGGFLIDDDIRTGVMLELFLNLKMYLIEYEVKKIIYKAIPSIYHLAPAEEDLYALFINEAKLVRRDVSAAINYDYFIGYNSLRQRQIKKSAKLNLTIKNIVKASEVWPLIRSVLSKHHEVEPVHNESEIDYLSSLFPNNIKTFAAYKESTILAAVVIFETPNVAHAQYIASSEDGRKSGALDYLFNFIICEYKTKKKFFDFGISNEDQGRFLNKGLVNQKEGFGARAITHSFYEIGLI